MRHVFIGPALVACVLFVEPPALSSIINVDTSTDELNSDGDCSLREAVTAANTNAAVDACPAGEAANLDVINLPNLSSAYNLTISGFDDTAAAGDLDLTGDTRIVGAPAAVGAPGNDRVFHVLSGNVQLEGLIIQGGTPGGFGGGILNSATLILNSVTVNANLAHANGSGVACGGAIFNTGTLTLNNSIVGNNAVTAGVTGTARGGGICNQGGTLTLNSSTVFGNRAQSGALGLSQGGGIYTSGGSTTLNSTTPSGNTALTGIDGTGQGPNTYP